MKESSVKRELETGTEAKTSSKYMQWKSLLSVDVTLPSVKNIEENRFRTIKAYVSTFEVSDLDMPVVFMMWSCPFAPFCNFQTNSIIAEKKINDLCSPLFWRDIPLGWDLSKEKKSREVWTRSRLETTFAHPRIKVKRWTRSVPTRNSTWLNTFDFCFWAWWRKSRWDLCMLHLKELMWLVWIHCRGIV